MPAGENERVCEDCPSSVLLLLVRWLGIPGCNKDSLRRLEAAGHALGSRVVYYETEALPCVGYELDVERSDDTQETSSYFALAMWCRISMLERIAHLSKLN